MYSNTCEVLVAGDREPPNTGENGRAREGVAGGSAGEQDQQLPEPRADGEADAEGEAEADAGGEAEADLARAGDQSEESLAFSLSPWVLLLLLVHHLQRGGEGRAATAPAAL